MTAKTREELQAERALAYPDRLAGQRLQAGDLLENIIDSFEAAPTNVTTINSLSDFPDPVGGVIELTDGDNKVYEIACDTIDVGANRFTVTGGTCVIRGVSRAGSVITGSTSGTLFTNTGTLAMEFIRISAADAQVFATTSSTLILQNAVILTCDTLGVITNSFASFRIATVVSATTGGFTWAGANSQFNMSTFLALAWGGTLFDLDDATFGLISIDSGCRFISGSGDTVISGAASNANVPSGRALVRDCLFDGPGTYLDGISASDTRWSFQGNIFDDAGATQNSRNEANAYLSSGVTTTISTADTFTAIGGTSFVSTIASRFTVSTAGVMTYTGLNDIEVFVMATATVEKVGGGSDQVCLAISVDGTPAPESESCTENTNPTTVVSQGLFQISNGDTIQLVVKNVDSTANISVSKANMIVRGD